jgi:hypothetical protein
MNEQTGSLRQTAANLLLSLAERAWPQANTAAVSAEVRHGDNAGWTQLDRRPNDRSHSELVELYRDALEATRKNPLAKAVVDITTDFVLGDGISLSSTHRQVNTFLHRFWSHPQNRLPSRLQAMSDELARAGDLFVLLFRNPADGMSYVRFVIKEQIVAIRTADNDWETELEYHQVTQDPLKPVVWLSPSHPEADRADAVMLHYAVNRPIGASFGEGDLDTIIPWLLRYSRMLEARVRIHWALRSFLWFVRVPSHMVEVKQAQYANPPEPGSIVVHDEAEEWEVKTPNLNAADARYDLQAVRQMVDAVGYPPHWRGEPGAANLATATAMQIRPERHLRRRQNFLAYILKDMVYQAYLRAAQLGFYSGGAPRPPFERLFTVVTSDISRSDNHELAQAARHMAETFSALFQQFPARQSGTLAKLALRLILKFAGEPQDDQILDAILRESGLAPGAGRSPCAGPSLAGAGPDGSRVPAPEQASRRTGEPTS